MTPGGIRACRRVGLKNRVQLLRGDSHANRGAGAGRAAEAVGGMLCGGRGRQKAGTAGAPS